MFIWKDEYDQLQSIIKKLKEENAKLRKIPYDELEINNKSVLETINKFCNAKKMDLVENGFINNIDDPNAKLQMWQHRCLSLEEYCEKLCNTDTELRHQNYKLQRDYNKLLDYMGHMVSGKRNSKIIIDKEDIDKIQKAFKTYKEFFQCENDDINKIFNEGIKVVDEILN